MQGPHFSLYSRSPLTVKMIFSDCLKVVVLSLSPTVYTSPGNSTVVYFRCEFIVLPVFDWGLVSVYPKVLF